MLSSLLRTNKDVEEIYLRHVDSVYRVCFLYMKNPADTEDAVSETFLRLMNTDQSFHDCSHERAWLVKVASNICKNTLKHWWRRNANVDDLVLPADTPEDDRHILEQVMALPDKYKTVIYLYYYEGYKSAEIAELLHKNHSTVRSLLKKGREILKLVLEEGES